MRLWVVEVGVPLLRVVVVLRLVAVRVSLLLVLLVRRVAGRRNITAKVGPGMFIIIMVRGITAAVGVPVPALLSCGVTGSMCRRAGRSRR